MITFYCLLLKCIRIGKYNVSVCLLSHKICLWLDFWCTCLSCNGRHIDKMAFRCSEVRVWVRVWVIRVEVKQTEHAWGAVRDLTACQGIPRQETPWDTEMIFYLPFVQVHRYPSLRCSLGWKWDELQWKDVKSKWEEGWVWLAASSRAASPWIRSFWA